MSTAGILVYIPALLLVISGTPKLINPSATRQALASLGLPSSPPAVRAIAVWEILVGAAVIIVGGWVAALLLTLTYAAFAAFIVAARLSPSRVSSCGCFGQEDSPPTTVHLVADLAGVAIGLVAAFASAPSFVDMAGDQPAAGIPMVIFIAVGTWLAYLVISVLPNLLPGTES